MRPVLMHLPGLGLPVYAYGTMLYLSFLIGWGLSLSLCARDGLSVRRAKACFLLTALTAIAGARLLFVLTNLDAFTRPADLLSVSNGGLVAYGGFLGGLGGAVLGCRLFGLPFFTWADCAVPALCTGLAVTRIGCLLAGCDFGLPWDGPWAVQFPAGSPAFHEQVARGLLAPEAARSLPVHPTQIYESLAGAALLGLVLWARRVRPAHGAALAAFACGYAVLRYGIEGLRADPYRGSLGAWSTSQIIAMATGAAGLLLLAWLRRAARTPAGSRASGAR